MLQIAKWLRSGHPSLFFCLIVIVYGALLLPTVGRYGISWDEQTDVDIARSYISQPGGWFVGSPSDPSQARLPMFTVALAWVVLGVEGLVVGRLVSCLAGALTLVATYIYGRREYGRARGLLASCALATSPFFLSFSRIAFTETDVYVACAFAWLLVCTRALRTRRTVGPAAVTAAVLGLAISAKLTAVTITPAIVLTILAWPRGTARATRHERLSKGQFSTVAAWTAATGATVLGGWAAAPLVAPGADGVWFKALHYALALLGWTSILVWTVRHRDRAVGRWGLVCLVIPWSLLTFAVIPPVHTTNPRIVASLVGKVQDEMGPSLRFMAEAATLYIGSILLKSSPGIGLGLLAGAVAAWRGWKDQPAVRFPLLILACYSFSLLILPFAQTFYVVPLLPVLAILGVDRWCHLYARQRVLALCLGGAAVALLVVDLKLCYPDYNLNGYQYLGVRRLAGRSTIGYRSIAYTTSDGVEQAVRWMNEHARPGERVVAYVYPWHIVRAVSPDPPFAIVRGEEGSLRTGPDYVVRHINHEIRQRWAGSRLGEEVFWQPYDADLLHGNYTKVFSVQRAFGIEVASVWKKK